jgi:hypothetical protein
MCAEGMYLGSRAAFPPAGMGIIFLSVLLSGCDGSRDGPEADPAMSGPPPFAVRILNPRGTPRSAFDARLEADFLGGDLWALRFILESPRGGAGSCEFSLPEGFDAVEGALRRDLVLQPGIPSEERLVIRVPRDGYRTIAASAVIEGRREEAYADFGERQDPEAMGLRVRVRDSGDQVIRFDESDVGR